MPIYQVWKLVAIAKKAKVCDTLVQYQERVIQLGIRAEASADSLLTLTREEVTAVRALAKEWEAKYNVQVSLTAVVVRQKRKWVAIAIVSIIVLVGETVLVIAGAAH